MSDENKNLEVQEIKEEKKCFCKSEEFKKFLIVTFGSFVGVFLALSLFAALHKPPMPIVPHHFGPRPAIEHSTNTKGQKHTECTEKWGQMHQCQKI